MVTTFTDNNTQSKPRSQDRGFAVSRVTPRSLYASEETLLLSDALNSRVHALEQQVSDHAQRFDTLQTPWWKRLWFLIDGWPWYDLNGTRQRRPWRKGWRWKRCR